MAADHSPRLIFQDLARSIDVWLVPLANDGGDTAEQHALLSSDERKKVAGSLGSPFTKKRDFAASDARERSRKAFYYTHQRKILAKYLGQDPADVPIERGRLGKPFVPGNRLTFNASDSDRKERAFGVIAVHMPPEGAPMYDLGVDIEPQGSRLLAAMLALTAASPAEQGELLWQPKGNFRTAVTRMWTRKEAIVKATGVGLAAVKATVTEPMRHPLDERDNGAIRSWRWVGGRRGGHVRTIHHDAIPNDFSVSLAWKPRHTDK